MMKWTPCFFILQRPPVIKKAIKAVNGLHQSYIFFDIE